MNGYLQAVSKNFHTMPWAYKVLFFVVMLSLCLRFFRRKPQKKRQQVAQEQVRSMWL